MNRKTYKNILLSLGLLTLVLLSCDKRSDDEKWQAEIRYFIMTQSDDFNSYQSIDFQRIDLDFLMSQGDIKESLLALRDTTQIKLRYYASIEQASDELISKLSERVGNFLVDQVDEFQLDNARLDNALNQYFDEAPDVIASANLRMQAALAQLNTSLASYGLSIYNINLTDGNTVFYHHTFQLQGLEHAGIFELNKETMEVSSFKEIG